MSVQNPYSGVNISVKPYFANEGFEHDGDTGRPADTELKEKLPRQGAESAQHNGTAAKTRPVTVPNPYGSVYRSTALGSGQAEDEEGEVGRACPCPCCRRGGCCACCGHCLIS